MAKKKEGFERDEIYLLHAHKVQFSRLKLMKWATKRYVDLETSKELIRFQRWYKKWGQGFYNR